MARFFIELHGGDGDAEGREFANVEEARNAAVEMLGKYLQGHPGFAADRHWRVDVRDHARRLLLHVIVATVDAPKPINFASFESSPAGTSLNGQA